MVIGLLLILGLIVLDQISKVIIVLTMNKGQSIKIINDFFYITSHRNTGAAWGVLEGKMIVFYIMTLVALGMFGYMFYTMYKKKGWILDTALVCVIAGTIGNFIDRLFRKEVVDFLDFKIFGYDYPIFNVADILLVTGVIAFMIYMIFIDGKDSVKNNG